MELKKTKQSKGKCTLPQFLVANDHLAVQLKTELLVPVENCGTILNIQGKREKK